MYNKKKLFSIACIALIGFSIIACDAVGLGGGGSGNGGTGGGNVNLVGTTWRYTSQEGSIDGYVVTITLNFTSSDIGTWHTSSTEGWTEDGIFYYSVSEGGALTMNVMDSNGSTLFGSVNGGVMTLTDEDGLKDVFYKV